MMKERQRLGKSRKDIFTHLLGEDEETGTVFTQTELQASADLVIVSGTGPSAPPPPTNKKERKDIKTKGSAKTDTTSMTLICILRELALSPEMQRKIRSELPASGAPLTCANTANLPYLNAVINETLRLWPAVPSGAQAVTPPAGYWIAGTYVPGNVAVRINHCAIMTGYPPLSPEGEIERGGMRLTVL